MGTTSNYSWPYPESTDPVADGAADIQALADAADTTGRAIQLATVQRFADATARNTALSGIEVEGMFAFLQDTDVLTYWDGTAWQEFSTGADVFAVDYLVVGGGGGGSSYSGGGGGAGGVIEGTTYKEATSYTVTVGAGGAHRSGRKVADSGKASRFDDIFGIGGGGGGPTVSGGQPACDGGSGGGAGGASGTIGSGADGQGYSGGSSGSTGGGGGGAGEAGNGSGSGHGGHGAISTIISDTQASTWSVGEVVGSDVYYGGGGAGGDHDSGTSQPGGNGGGGDGGTSGTSGQNGTANTGGGGGGEGAEAYSGGAGGSGVVIIKWLTADASISVGAGLTYSNTTDGDHTIYAFTAGTGTVTFS